MSDSFVRARRPEHKQQRRDAILSAARDLALERGVRGVTLGDLAASVGLAKSNVVRYFGTREEIFVELCSQEGLRLRDALAPRLADVTQETLPGVLAATLMEHELFCELVSQLTTHLEHHVGVGDPRVPDDASHGVRVDHEVLPALLGGAQVERCCERTHFCRTEKSRSGRSGRAHGDEASGAPGGPITQPNRAPQCGQAP